MSDIKTYIKLLKKYHQRQFIIDGDDEKYAKYFIFLAKEIYNITDDTIKQLLKKIIINSIYINREILFFICNYNCTMATITMFNKDKYENL